jgi:SNF2 family DNA or RNA helicase
MEKAFRNYGLSIVLIILFLLAWLLQGTFQWQQFVNEAQQNNRESKVEEFTPEFLASTFENWQSEFLQLATFVILSTYLIHKGSPQSKDSDEEIKQMIKGLQKKAPARRK